MRNDVKPQWTPSRWALYVLVVRSIGELRTSWIAEIRFLARTGKMTCIYLTIILQTNRGC